MGIAHKEKSTQYFIAIIPPQPIYDDALKLKELFREKYQSKAALKSPPHITLHMPFRWKDDKEDKLVESLASFAKTREPVKVCIDDFSSFPPRVIFINVVASEQLKALQHELQRFCKRELNLFNANYKEHAFHPHLTLAFRDLKKAAYKLAWEEFESNEYRREFIADKISLLRHDGKKWEVFRDLPLTSGKA